MATQEEIFQAVVAAFQALENDPADTQLDVLRQRIIDRGSSKFGFENDQAVWDFDQGDVMLFHYARNLLNPDWNEANFVENLHHFYLETDSRSQFHKQGGGNSDNLKFLGSDGHWEFVLRPSLEGFDILDDGASLDEVEVMGTYNFAEKGDDLGHTKLDILPWILWGNSANDPSTPLERLDAFPPAYLPLNDLFVGTAIKDFFGAFLPSNYRADFSSATTWIGGSGDDVFRTSSGSQVLLGYGGNDTLAGGMDADFLDGGQGTDTADYSGSSEGIILSLLAGRGYNGDASADHQPDELYSIENVLGSNHADLIFGTGHANDIRGQNGNDEIGGGGGNDIIFGGGGSDRLHGDEDQDELKGETGNDHLFGGAGRDKLWGDENDDTLNGGAENDTLDGGPDTDTAQYNYNSSYYRPVGQLNPLDFQLEALRFEEGTDRLINIEYLQFANETVSVSSYLARFAPVAPNEPPPPTSPPIIEPIPDPDPIVVPPPSGSGPPKLYFFPQSLGEGNSGSRLVDIYVGLDRVPTSPVTFFFSAVSDTGIGTATPGSDFDAFYARTVTIPAGQTVAAIPIRIYGDTKIEPNEYFSGLVSNLSGAVLSQGGYVDLEKITIVNDDGTQLAEPPPPPAPPPPGPVYLTLRQSSVTELEGPAGTETIFEFDVRKTGDLSVETRFSLEVNGYGVAPATPDDFVGGEYPSTERKFDPGEDRYTFRVRVAGDATTEPIEYFHVDLDAISQGARVIEDDAYGVILNDDGTTPPPPLNAPVYISINPLDAVKAEGTDVTYDPADGIYYANSTTAFTFEVVRSGDLGQISTVKYRVLTGQGLTPQSDSHDLQTSTRTLTFNPGENRKVISYGVRTDNENEPDEPLFARISWDSSTPNVEIVREVAEGTILNDDGPAPPLVSPVLQLVRETDSDQIVMFRVEISHTMSVPVSMGYEIGYYTNEHYPATLGDDYVAGTGTLTIPPGSTYGEIPITIKGDTIPERLEAVMVRLSDPINGYFGKSLTDWDSGIIVADDDGPDPFPSLGIEFEAKAIDLGVLGNYGWVETALHLDSVTPTHIFKITLDSAQALSVFADGTRPDFIFDSAGDLFFVDATRFDETPYADIYNGVADGRPFPAGPYYFVVEQKAIDSDGSYGFAYAGAPSESEQPLIWIRGRSTSAAPGGFGVEGSPAVVEVRLSSPSTSDITYQIEYRDVSAGINSDFAPWNTQLQTIPAGDTWSNHWIDILGDSLFEGPEQFDVVITNVTGAVLANSRDEQSTTITIIDSQENTNSEFDIVAELSDRAEGSANGGEFTFIVSRPAAHSAGAAQVDWTVLGDGTSPASANDFASGLLPSGTLSFADGETSQVITIGANGDRLSEADETFRVVLSNPSAGFAVGIAEAVGVIRNDDGLPKLAILPDGTIEVGTSYELTAEDLNVLLSGGSNADLVGNELKNILSGNNAQNKIYGLGGNDSLFGYQGDDTLDGGSGDDSHFGGPGDDTYFVDSPLDLIVENVSEGEDTVFSVVAFTLSSEIENLELLGTANLNGTGNALANVIKGNSGSNQLNGGSGPDALSGGKGDDMLFGENGHDMLYGGGDNDTLDGGPGNDTLDGGSGIDTASYASATGGVTVYLTILGAQNTAGAGNDTLSEIENLIGSVFGDNLNGDSGANTISGGTGPDTITGQAGDDVLNGDSGRDVLRGGPGNDVINGGRGRDQLYGGADDDTLDGGPGHDSLTGGSGIDTASYASATGGVMVFLNNLGAQNTFGAGIDTLSGIENLTGSDYGDTLSGDSGANAIAGGAGPDTIVGQAGDDVLNGDGGRDELRGGSGNDVLNGGLGIDELTGGLDADRFVFDDPTHTEVADPDTILDFDELAGDRIDLSAIDAIAGGADDPFTFVAGGAFNSTAGALIVVNHAAGQYRVEGDINGDNLADFAIIVTATAMPTVGAFIV